MDSPSSQPQSGSARLPLADRISRLIEEQTVARYVAAGVLIWLWITCLRFTISISNDVALSGLRFPRYGSPSLIDVALSFTPLLAVFPLIIAWSALLRLTSKIVNYLRVSMVDSPNALVADTPITSSTESDPSESQSIPCDDEPRVRLLESLRLFERWFYFFAISWLVLIASGVIQTILVAVLGLFDNSLGRAE